MEQVSVFKSPTSFFGLSFSSFHNILKCQNAGLVGTWVSSSHQTSLMQFFFLPPLSLAVFDDFFCTDVLFQHYTRRMFMRAENSIASKVTQPVTREKGSKDQAIQGMQGTGRVLPPVSGGRTSALSWGEVVSLNFAWSQRHIYQRWQSTMAHWFLLCGEANACLRFSSHPLQYIVIPAVCIWFHPHFFLCLRTN